MHAHTPKRKQTYVHMCWHTIKAEAVFIKTEMTDDSNINLFQNSPFGIQWTYSSSFPLILVWFLCLMVYQPLWVIQCQNHSSQRTIVVIFNLWLWCLVGLYLSKGYLFKTDHNKTTGVQTFLQSSMVWFGFVARQPL